MLFIIIVHFSVGARERKKGIFCSYNLFCPKEIVLTYVFYLNA